MKKQIVISSELHDKLRIKAIHNGLTLQQMADRVLLKALT